MGVGTGIVGQELGVEELRLLVEGPQMMGLWRMPQNSEHLTECDSTQKKTFLAYEVRRALEAEKEE